MGWLDHQTRDLTVTVMLYNPNYQIYSTLLATFSFSTGGRIIPSYQIESMPAHPYNDSQSSTIALLEALTWVSGEWGVGFFSHAPPHTTHRRRHPTAPDPTLTRWSCFLACCFNSSS